MQYSRKYFELSKQDIIKYEFRTGYLNNKERELITSLCLQYYGIFYLEGDHLTFTNEITRGIETNNARLVFTKSYRYIKTKPIKCLIKASYASPFHRGRHWSGWFPKK